MILGMEIGLAIFGILALVKGKMTLSKNKVVVGAPARLLGLLALMPLPVAFGVGLLYALSEGPVNAGRVADDNKLALAAVEGGIVVLFAVLVFGIGAAVGITPQEAERRERRAPGRYDEDDRYDDDERPGKRDEDDDDRPRKRREW
jgi:hypothetical protein